MFRIVFTLCIGKTMTCDSGFRIPGFRVARCMPLNNPNRRYHPHLEVFKEIRGTNTECAEQSNRFLNRFKHVCNGMTEFEFSAFLWFVIETRNELIEERLKGKGKMK